MSESAWDKGRSFDQQFQDSKIRGLVREAQERIKPFDEKARHYLEARRSLRED